MKKTFILLFVLTISVSLFAQTVGPQYPGSGSGTGWTNPGNITSSSSTYATDQIATNGNSNFLVGTNYDFSTIPNGSTINGITVTIRRHSDHQGSSHYLLDNSVRILKGGSAVGSDYKTSSSWSTSNVNVVYGGATNKWGTTWTVSDIKASNFGAEIQVHSQSGSYTASVAYIQITVDYTAAQPVELTSFTGSVQNNVVNLKWATATEVNNYGFNVERRVKAGKSWEKIGFVAGNGNSNSLKEYSYADKNLAGGSEFAYRLKQVDNDGTFEYSNVVEVALVPDKIELYQNYPNPFNPSTTIKFSLPEASRVAINIYNMLGEKVMELANGEFEAGNQEVHLNASGLASGMYVYSIETQNFKAVKKMVLLR